MPEKPKLNYYIIGFIIIFQAVSVLAIQRYIVFNDLKFSVESTQELITKDVESKNESKTLGLIFEFRDEIVINPSETYAIRFLATSIAVELTEKNTEENMKLWEPVLRDKIITLLMSKRMDFYTNPDNKLLLKQEVHSLIEELIGEDKIIDVYFTKFVLQ